MWLTQKHWQQQPRERGRWGPSCYKLHKKLKIQIASSMWNAEIIRNKITNSHKQDLKCWSFFCCNKSVILAFCSLFQSRAERNIDWIKQWSVKYQLNFDSFILKQVAWFICTCRDLPEVLCSLSNVGKEWFLGAVSALLYSLDKWNLLWNLHNKQFTHLVAFTMYYSNFTAPNRAPSRSHPASVILLLGFSQKKNKVLCKSYPKGYCFEYPPIMAHDYVQIIWSSWAWYKKYSLWQQFTCKAKPRN